MKESFKVRKQPPSGQPLLLHTKIFESLKKCIKGGGFNKVDGRDKRHFFSKAPLGLNKDHGHPYRLRRFFFFLGKKEFSLNRKKSKNDKLSVAKDLPSL